MNHLGSIKHITCLILVLFLLFITACSEQRSNEITSTLTPIPSPSAIAPSPSGIVETDNPRGVIFTAEQIAARTYWPNSKDPWTPSEADIATFEAQLAAYLQEPYPDLWQKSAGYARQYWGTATEDGRRAIYANFFCDDHGMVSDYDWRAKLVQIDDGGDCYFQTLFDIENGSFEWLVINGVS